MVEITENAKKYVLDQSPKTGAPLSIVIREIEYSSWCGVRKIVQVDLVDTPPQSSRFEEVSSQGEQIKVFVDRAIKGQVDGKKIDLIGWSYYQRLALI